MTHINGPWQECKDCKPLDLAVVELTKRQQNASEMHAITLDAFALSGPIDDSPADDLRDILAQRQEAGDRRDRLAALIAVLRQEIAWHHRDIEGV
ncbi:hypothetical protein [Candidatus Poriferisodalis sp.]|uniref:hypothetical protein n=1 Tax=Candidatus Poriferisodalis sp. TaxID=3101277 RepID=UPI003B027898